MSPMLGYNGGLRGTRRVPTTGAASGIWTPDEQADAKRASIWPISGGITGLNPVLWYDFADESTVTTSSGAITQITDKGSLGRTLTASATGPTYSTTINGLKVSDWGTSAHSNYLRNTDATGFTVEEIYCVADSSETSSISNSGLLGSYTDVAKTILMNGSGSGFEGPLGGGYYIDRVYLNGGTTDKYSNVFPEIASPCILRMLDTRGPITGTTGGFQIGRDRNNSNRGWRGLIAEVVCFSAALSSGDRAIVQETLAAKWGITLEGQGNG